MNDREVPITPDLLEKILSSVGEESVLVGGQALAVWLTSYQISSDLVGYVTDDADVLGDRDDVARIAQRLHGSANYPPKFGLSALVGSVKLRVSSDAFVSIDVIHKVIGIKNEDVRKHAFAMLVGETKARIMHPLEVLKSRIENLRLADKQTSKGIAQATLAILIARKYIEEVAADPELESIATKAVEQVVSIAKSRAGRRASRDYGIAFLDAIPPDAIKNVDFRVERLPRIIKELRSAAGPADD